MRRRNLRQLAQGIASDPLIESLIVQLGVSEEDARALIAAGQRGLDESGADEHVLDVGAFLAERDAKLAWRVMK